MSKSIINLASRVIRGILRARGLLKPGYGNKDLAREIAVVLGMATPPPGRKAAQQALIAAYDKIAAMPKGDRPRGMMNPNKRARAVKNAFYLSDEWRTVRYRALVLHGGACQCCGATAKTSGRPMHVDHVKPRSKYPELQLEINNLQVLCEDCNKGKSAWDETDWR